MDTIKVQGRVHAILHRDSNPQSRFIRDYHELGLVINELKVLGKKIVLTKGVFDLIHVGHLRYLEKARAHGDILVVSIDTDRLTKQRKGSNRPVVPEDERIEMLTGLRPVDVVIVRDIDLPSGEYDVEVVQPDVLITSSTTADYGKDTKEFIANEYGVQVVTLEAQAVTTTSARIRTLMVQGVGEFASAILKLVSDFTGKDPRTL